MVELLRTSLAIRGFGVLKVLKVSFIRGFGLAQLGQ